jgi:hypothetical protein
MIVADQPEIITTPSIHWSSDWKRIVVTRQSLKGDYEPAAIYDAASGKLERTVGSNVIGCWVSPGGGWALCLPSARATLGSLQVLDLRSGRRVETMNADDIYVSPDLSTVLSQFGWRRGLTKAWHLKKSAPTTTAATQPER